MKINRKYHIRKKGFGRDKLRKNPKYRTIPTTMHRYGDEIEVTFVGAVGVGMGNVLMPKVMEKGLKKLYIESGAVKSTYMFINGKEITDRVDYNPLHR